jgi:predicted Fe-S protein YdhL (DUF1289 family)
LYLDVHTHTIENYVGDYYTVIEEINKRVEREQRKNAQLEKTIQDRKESFLCTKVVRCGGCLKLKDETENWKSALKFVRSQPF